MNRPLFAALGIACFAGGWGIDAWVADALHEAAIQKRDEAAAAAEKSRRPAEGGPAASTPPAVPARAATAGRSVSVDELLKLITPGSPNASSVRLDEAVAGLSAEELAALAAEFKTLAKDWHREQKDRPARLAVLERWLAVEPARAAEHIVPSYNSGDELVSALKRPFAAAIGLIMQQDFAKAVQLVNRIRERDLYIDIRWEWVHSLKGMAPEMAVPLIVEFDEKTRNQWYRANIMADFPKLWIAKDAPAAMNWALRIPPGYSHERTLRYLTNEWAAVNPAEAGAFLDGVPLTVLPNGSLRDQLLSAVKKQEPKNQ